MISFLAAVYILTFILATVAVIWPGIDDRAYLRRVYAKDYAIRYNVSCPNGGSIPGVYAGYPDRLSSGMSWGKLLTHASERKEGQREEQ